MLLQMVRFLCFGWSYSILYTTVSLSILPLVDTGYFQVLTIINIAAMNIKKMVFFFIQCFYFPWIYSQLYDMELLYHMAILFSTFWVTSILSSIVSVPIHIYQQYTSVLSSTSSVTLWISCFFIIVILTGMGRYNGFSVHFASFW